MKRAVKLITLSILAVIAVFYISQRNPVSAPDQTSQPPSTNSTDAPDTTVIAENLDTPWALAFLPDNSILLTERPGRVRFIDANGTLDPSPVATIQNATEIGEGGLMGIAIHPNFSLNNYVYFYYTYSSNGDNTLNRVVRMTYKNKVLSSEKIIVDRIPGASNHNGGRIKFGPDNFLYIGTGDASQPSLSQNTNSLAGKILRVTDEGKPAPGNPFNNLVYSYGHRNVQGLTWHTDATFWATEHGSSTHDELNFIEPGKNYGWPGVTGDQSKPGINSPFLESESDTWAPGGLTFSDGSFFFAGLRGQALFQVKFEGGPNLYTHFKREYGRIRDVVTGPDGLLYITTSNNDGRGIPNSGDDKVIKLNPKNLR